MSAGKYCNGADGPDVADGGAHGIILVIIIIIMSFWAEVI